ncbi:MAG: hypothetical protein DI551_02300 [Micavibrio aeruginosavorus]|uniref:O-antigen ligase-related domain-containing protein n=1 Tax=Micavibrio aeruginosavorus TaxID=349221 RepID=A0A2W5PTF8_9BACT|nr:MAG: hypothetical protein DI551_02300 [Micavibrio aeruginosavorus]
MSVHDRARVRSAAVDGLQMADAGVLTMKAGALEFCREHKAALPFLILFTASLFLPSASLRLVFYILAPFLCSFLYKARHELKPFIQTRSFAFLMLYLAYFLASGLWSDNFTIGEMVKLLRNVVGIGLFCTALAVAIPRFNFNVNKAPFYFAGACLAWGVLCVVLFYGFEGREWEERLQGLGRYDNSIHLALLFCCATLALICAWDNKAERHTLQISGMMVGFLALIALTQTRSAYVGLGLCLLPMFFFGHKKCVAIIVAFAVFAIGIVFFSGLVPVGELGNRLDSYRFEIWSEAIEGIEQFPVTGHGVLVEPTFFDHVVRAHKNGFSSTHNVFLGHAYFGGFIGLFLFLCISVNIAYVLLKRYMQERAAGAYSYSLRFGTLMICLVYAASLFNFAHYVVNVHVQWIFFWAPFSLIWSFEAANAGAGRPVHA